MDNLKKFKLAFASALSIAESDVVDELRYQSIPEWDSITHMVLITELEDAFAISVDTDDVIDMSTVAKAKEILGKYNIEF
ncbi:MAG: acyl carrier protein [Chitinophagia bacterium]|nr:acyl carrier protein [Chitinophagia bacterium]